MKAKVVSSWLLLSWTDIPTRQDNVLSDIFTCHVIFESNVRTWCSSIIIDGKAKLAWINGSVTNNRPLDGNVCFSEKHVLVYFISTWWHSIPAAELWIFRVNCPKLNLSQLDERPQTSTDRMTYPKRSTKTNGVGKIITLTHFLKKQKP